MAQYFRLISMVLLFACAANVADASHLVLNGPCSGSTVLCGETRTDLDVLSILITGDSNAFSLEGLTVTASQDEKQSSEQSSGVPEKDHQCHFGHCSFIISVPSDFSVRFNTAEITLIRNDIPASSSLSSIDRPPRA